MHVLVDGRVVLVDGDAVLGVVLCADAEHGTAVGVLCVDLHPLPCGEVVTTGETPAGANLQEVDELQCLDVLPPRFLADHPTSRNGGEGAPVVVGCELRRGIRAQQEFEQVAVGVCVVDASDVRQRTALGACEHRCHLTVGRVILLCGEGVGVLALSLQVLALGLRLLDREQGADMVLAEVAGILCGEVHLVVVRTCRRAVQHVTVVVGRTVEVRRVQIVERRVVARCRRVQVVARTVAARHLVQRIVRAVLVGLVVVDALRIREAQLQTFQQLAPSEVVRQATVDAHVVRHVAAVVAVVLQHVEVVVLILVALSATDAIGGNGVTVDIFGNVCRTREQQVVVLLVTRSADLHQRRVLLAVVTADGQVGRQVVADLHVDAGAIVPAVVVELAQVTVLLEVGDAAEVAHLLGSSADVHGVTRGIARRPVFVEQVVVQRLHGLQLVGLEECCRVVQRRVRRVCCRNGVIQTSVVVGAEQLRTGHLVGETNATAIADAGRALLTLLRSHQDDTVGGAGTVDGCRRILQHRDALDFRGVQVVEGFSTQILRAVAHLDVVGIDVSVDDEQRLLGGGTHLTQGTYVTNRQTGILAGTGVTAAHRQTVHQS